jgi:hypothetical protein
VPADSEWGEAVKLIVVVGSGSGCGKTTVACRILRGISGLGAVKLSPRRGPLRIEWGAGVPGKDTDLFAASGAAKVARIIGPRNEITQAWERIRGDFQACRGVVIEGAQGSNLQAERYVVFVGGDLWRQTRSGRNTELAARADDVIERSIHRNDEDLLRPILGFIGDIAKD